MSNFGSIHKFTEAVGLVVFGNEYCDNGWIDVHLRNFCEGLCALHWHTLRNFVTRTQKRVHPLRIKMTGLRQRESSSAVIFTHAHSHRS